jgi:hypothetical protein
LKEWSFGDELGATFSTADRTPRITPLSRRWRTSERVSRPETTGIEAFERKSRASSSERQLLVMEENSRTTRPSM